LKYKKTKGADLQLVKNTVLSLFKHDLSLKQSLSFAVLFCQLDAICEESGVSLSSICTMSDLLSHEHLFYSSLWRLEELGVAHHLTAFSAFMRANSVRPVLEINRTITAHMTTPSPPLPLPDSLQNTRSLLYHFTLTPTALAHQVLLYYLEQSSIALPQGEKRRSRRSRTVKSLVLDPLHFLMVKTAFWEDSSSRDVLELALWITLDAYCKWVLQLKPKDCTPKETAEYLKKLNLAVVVFLLGLPYPTKMLQYYPIECDILKDLFILPLFPTLILSSPVLPRRLSSSSPPTTATTPNSRLASTPASRPGLSPGLTCSPPPRQWSYSSPIHGATSWPLCSSTRPRPPSPVSTLSCCWTTSAPKSPV
jgi:hypothetical protein